MPNFDINKMLNYKELVKPQFDEYLKKEKEKEEKEKKQSRIRHRELKQKHSYNQTMYSFDMECSDTVNNPDWSGVDNYAFPFMMCVSSFNIDMPLDIENCIHECCVRYLEDIVPYLKSWSDVYTDTYAIFHNGGKYDWHFLFQNPQFFEGVDPTSVFGYSPTRFIKFDWVNPENGNRIHFIDSWIITSKSINALGIELGLPKLKDQISYSDYITPDDELPEEWIEYNYRDCDIAILGLIMTMRRYSWFKSVRVFDKVYTSTGLVRMDMKRNPMINKPNHRFQEKEFREHGLDQYDYTAVSNKKLRDVATIHYAQSFYDTVEDYQYAKKCYYAGMVVQNFKLLGKPVTNYIYHADLRSSYPTQILLRLFPYQKFVTPDNPQEAWANCNADCNSIDWNFPFDHVCTTNSGKPVAYMLHLKLNGFEANNKFNFLASAKVHNAVNAVVICGKVIKADSLEWYGTELDYAILCKCYNWKSVECLEIKQSYMKPCEPWVVEAVNYYANRKTGAKNYVAYLGGKNKSLENDVLAYGITQGEIDANPTIADAEAFLLAVKGQLNAIYGIMVEDILKENFNFDPETLTYEKDLETTVEELFNKRKRTSKGAIKRTQKTSYDVGIYICSWAHVSLVQPLWFMYKFGFTHITTDTDSHFGFFPSEEQMVAYDKFQQEFDARLVEIGYSNPIELGVFEHDDREDGYAMSTLGNKQYCILRKNLKTNTYYPHFASSGITISDDPNSGNYIMYKLWNDIITEQGADISNVENMRSVFNTFCDRYYHWNVEFPEDTIHKTTTSRATKGDRVDCFNRPVYAGVRIVPVGYNMRTFESWYTEVEGGKPVKAPSIWKDYTMRLAMYYGNKLNTERVTITND